MAKLKDFKKSWSLINALTCRKPISTGIPEISTSNNSITDSKVISERSSVDAAFYLHQILIENVVLALRNLKPSKSSGLDKISAEVLKLSADIISPWLTYIFNLSLLTGIYVNEWKCAIVTPILKLEDRRKLGNCRPISIFPIDI